MRRIAIGLMALLAACTEAPADEALSVCASLCRCLDVPLPSAQRECTATCVAQFDRTPLGGACTACVLEHANRCTTLVDDCDSVCAQATPLQSYGAPDELGSEDQ